MSGPNNLCIDIFNNLSNLVRTFTSVSTNPTNTFSHGTGFTAQTQQPQMPDGGLADDWFQWLIVAALILFLVFGYRAP